MHRDGYACAYGRRWVERLAPSDFEARVRVMHPALCVAEAASSLRTVCCRGCHFILHCVLQRLPLHSALCVAEAATTLRIVCCRGCYFTPHCVLQRLPLHSAFCVAEAATSLHTVCCRSCYFTPHSVLQRLPLHSALCVAEAATSLHTVCFRGCHFTPHLCLPPIPKHSGPHLRIASSSPWLALFSISLIWVTASLLSSAACNACGSTVRAMRCSEPTRRKSVKWRACRAVGLQQGGGWLVQGRSISLQQQH